MQLTAVSKVNAVSKVDLAPSASSSSSFSVFLRTLIQALAARFGSPDAPSPPFLREAGPEDGARVELLLRGRVPYGAPSVLAHVVAIVVTATAAGDDLGWLGWFCTCRCRHWTCRIGIWTCRFWLWLLRFHFNRFGLSFGTTARWTGAQTRVPH
jgi:hypothetical protein